MGTPSRTRHGFPASPGRHLGLASHNPDGPITVEEQDLESIALPIGEDVEVTRERVLR